MLVYLPDYDLVMATHDAVLEISKGRPGIRDEHTIKSAIERPKTYLQYHDNCSIHTVCAVLLDSFARNHGFTDGNKRTAVLICVLTYEINGISFKSEVDEDKKFEDLVLWVVESKPDIALTTERLTSLVDVYGEKKVSKFAKLFKRTVKPIRKN